MFSVKPLTAAPGSRVKVSGVKFSGCPTQGSKAKPTPVLTVKVGMDMVSRARPADLTLRSVAGAAGGFGCYLIAGAIGLATDGVGLASAGLCGAAGTAVPSPTR